jgi:hypothetical protein
MGELLLTASGNANEINNNDIEAESVMQLLPDRKLIWSYTDISRNFPYNSNQSVYHIYLLLENFKTEDA